MFHPYRCVLSGESAADGAGESVRTSDNSEVTTFARAIEIRIPTTTTTSGLPAWSRDGLTWTLFPRLSQAVLPDGQADGYFVNADGSYSGGSGTEAMMFKSLDPSICTVAADGVVSGSAAGKCSVSGSRLTDSALGSAITVRRRAGTTTI